MDIFVNDALGLDSNPGTSDSPLRTVMRAAELAQAGDTVYVAPGVYPHNVRVKGEGQPDAPIRFLAQGPEVYLVGGVQPFGWKSDDGNGNDNVLNAYARWEGFTLSGLGMRNYGFLMRVGRGWTASHCAFLGGTNGANLRSHDASVVDSVFDGQDAHAICAYGGRNVTIARNVIRRINLLGRANPAYSSVTKFGYNPSNLVIEDNLIEDVVGPGLWLDYNSGSYAIRRNTIRYCRGTSQNWDGPGMRIEVGGGYGLITENTIEHVTGSAIAISESRRVAITHNRIVDGNDGIGFRLLDRRTDSTTDVIADLLVSDNHFDVRRAGLYRSAGIWDTIGWVPGDWNVLIDYNHYDRADMPVAIWGAATYMTREELAAGMGWEASPL